MVKPTEQKKRQKTLVIILIVVVIIAIIVWYFSLQGGPSIKVPAEGGVPSGVSPAEEMLKEIKLDFSVFDDSLFKSLKSHGTLPVVVGETGRENPFSSY